MKLLPFHLINRKKRAHQKLKQIEREANKQKQQEQQDNAYDDGDASNRGQRVVQEKRQEDHQVILRKKERNRSRSITRKSSRRVTLALPPLIESPSEQSPEPVSLLDKPKRSLSLKKRLSFRKASSFPVPGTSLLKKATEEEEEPALPSVVRSNSTGTSSTSNGSSEEDDITVDSNKSDGYYRHCNCGDYQWEHSCYQPSEWDPFCDALLQSTVDSWNCVTDPFRSFTASVTNFKAVSPTIKEGEQTEPKGEEEADIVKSSWAYVSESFQQLALAATGGDGDSYCHQHRCCTGCCYGERLATQKRTSDRDREEACQDFLFCSEDSDDCATPPTIITTHTTKTKSTNESGTTSSSSQASMQVEEQLWTDAKGHKGVYTGKLHAKTNQPHGRGKFQQMSGAWYDGKWKAGKRHGAGCSKEMVALDPPDKADNNTTSSHEQGIFHLYEGQFRNDLKHGAGTMTFSGGHVFQGQYRHDKMIVGKLTYRNQDVYKGEFADNVPHGQGIMQKANDSMYQGGFYNGKFHGTGTFTWSDGSKYHGEWLHGERHDKSKKAEKRKEGDTPKSILVPNNIQRKGNKQAEPKHAPEKDQASPNTSCVQQGMSCGQERMFCYSETTPTVCNYEFREPSTFPLHSNNRVGTSLLRSDSQCSGLGSQCSDAFSEDHLQDEEQMHQYLLEYKAKDESDRLRSSLTLKGC